MKIFRFLAALSLLAPLSWADDAPAVKKGRTPYEHRGFFFSAGMGVGYTSFSTYKENTRGDYTYEYYDYEKDEYVGWKEYKFLATTYDEEFSGVSCPLLEFRFGRSFGNLVAAYSVFEIGVFSGTGKFRRQDYDRPERLDENNVRVFADEDVLVEAHGAKGSVYAVLGNAGLGFSVYPFRNPNHILNGAFIGYASGISAISTISKNSDLEYGQIGVFTQFELGKDWWVSENWSAGVALSYSFVSNIEDDVYSVDEGDRNTIKLMLRMTRG